MVDLIKIPFHNITLNVKEIIIEDDSSMERSQLYNYTLPLAWQRLIRETIVSEMLKSRYVSCGYILYDIQPNREVPNRQNYNSFNRRV